MPQKYYPYLDHVLIYLKLEISRAKAQAISSEWKLERIKDVSKTIIQHSCAAAIVIYAANRGKASDCVSS